MKYNVIQEYYEDVYSAKDVREGSPIQMPSSLNLFILHWDENNDVALKLPLDDLIDYKPTEKGIMVRYIKRGDQ